MSVSASQPPRLPASFAGGRYRVIRLIGEGDSKAVYHAHDMKLHRDVAFALVKVAELDEAGRLRVSREARALARLGDHPHLVTIYDVGTAHGQPYIVSQYMASGSLEARLKKSRSHRLPIPEVVRIAAEVCEALEYAHSHGVIHRDLKPANILFTRDGTAKLGDLGFGLILATELSRQSGSIMVVGTVAYTAPEQALAKPCDARSDLYSLGAILYEMVTGRPPFIGDNLAAVVSQHVNFRPAPPSWRVPEMPASLEVLILRLLAKSIEERPKSAAAVREELRAIANEMKTSLVAASASAAATRTETTRVEAGDHAQAPRPGGTDERPRRVADDAHAFANGIRRTSRVSRRPGATYTWQAQTVRLNKAVRTVFTRHPIVLTASLVTLLAIGFASMRPERTLQSLGLAPSDVEQARSADSDPGEMMDGRRYERAIGETAEMERPARDEGAKRRVERVDPKTVALAESGDMYAQTKLGETYLTGHGAARDYGQALKWFRKAADQGDTNAKANLGKMYAKGQGVPQDYAEALQWFYQAAAQGNGEAEYRLARMYLLGEGITRDYAAALEWLRRAATQDSPDAECELAGLYLRGEIVPQDYSAAIGWFRRAAAQGSRSAQYELGKLYLLGEGVTQDDDRAVEWFTKAAGQGDAEAQNALGYMYEQGQGVSQDYDRALKWYREAATQGHAKAQLNLGLMYENGEGLPQNFAEAMRWFRDAADQGDTVAQTNLGFMYWKGRGVPQDYTKALRWFHKAADGGDAEAQYALGTMYDDGRGVGKNHTKAAQWYRIAADHGNRDAQYNLGYMYEYGQGVRQDLAAAVQWYRKAADQDDTDAIQKLRDCVIGSDAPTTASRD